MYAKHTILDVVHKSDLSFTLLLLVVVPDEEIHILIVNASKEINK